MTATPYDAGFYLDQQDGSLRSARVVIPMLLEAFRVRSAVDIGCGVGTWLSVLRDGGVDDVIGIDGDYVDRAMLKIPGQRFVAADLRQKLPVDRGFDLALCLEVAEHLPPALGEALVGHLTSLAPVVAFSAAIPGQGGTDHINEQWQDHWRVRFAKRGFRPYDVIRPRIWRNGQVEFWYRQNLVCYARDPQPFLLSVPDEVSLDLVHPELLDVTRRRGDMYLTKAVSMLPRLATAAARRRFSPADSSSG